MKFVDCANEYFNVVLTQPESPIGMCEMILNMVMVGEEAMMVVWVKTKIATVMMKTVMKMAKTTYR